MAALIAVRMLAELLCMLVCVVSGGAVWLAGHQAALSWFVVAAVVAWAVRVDDESKAAFIAFQQHRLAVQTQGGK